MAAVITLDTSSEEEDDDDVEEERTQNQSETFSFSGNSDDVSTLFGRKPDVMQLKAVMSAVKKFGELAYNKFLVVLKNHFESPNNESYEKMVTLVSDFVEVFVSAKKSGMEFLFDFGTCITKEEKRIKYYNALHSNPTVIRIITGVDSDLGSRDTAEVGINASDTNKGSEKGETNSGLSSNEKKKSSDKRDDFEDDPDKDVIEYHVPPSVVSISTPSKLKPTVLGKKKMSDYLPAETELAGLLSDEDEDMPMVVSGSHDKNVDKQGQQPLPKGEKQESSTPSAVIDESTAKLESIPKATVDVAPKIVPNTNSQKQDHDETCKKQENFATKQAENEKTTKNTDSQKDEKVQGNVPKKTEQADTKMETNKNDETEKKVDAIAPPYSVGVIGIARGLVSKSEMNGKRFQIVKRSPQIAQSMDHLDRLPVMLVGQKYDPTNVFMLKKSNFEIVEDSGPPQHPKPAKQKKRPATQLGNQTTKKFATVKTASHENSMNKAVAAFRSNNADAIPTPYSMVGQSIEAKESKRKYWKSCLDSKKRVYYYNIFTRRSVWRLPEFKEDIEDEDEE
eukprot:m.156710 g.156710  ORF g.156710 m.156710 type:complete len:564 (-) comp15103_c0_seq1:51-1742(-)